MDNKKPETASQMLESLNSFLLGEEPDFKSMPAKQVEDYLKDAHLDSQRVFKAVRAAVTRALGQQELSRAREKRQRIEARVRPRSGAAGIRESLLRQIEGLAGIRMAEVYARRFESATDEDLRSLVEDFELLEKLKFEDDER